MLDGLVALPGGQLDVGGGHVELQVDELLGSATRGMPMRNQEQRALRCLRGLIRCRSPRGDPPVPVTGVCSRRGAGRGARFQTGAQRARAVGGSGPGDGIGGGRGKKRDGVLAPARLDAGLGSQVHRGAPAPGAGDEVAADAPGRAGQPVVLAVQRRDDRFPYPLAAPRLEDGMAGDHVNTRLRRGLHGCA